MSEAKPLTVCSSERMLYFDYIYFSANLQCFFAGISKNCAGGFAGGAAFVV